MESQPQNAEFRKNPENFDPCRNIQRISHECSCVIKFIKHVGKKG